MKIQPLETGEAIEAIIDQYGNMVYRLAFARLKSKNDADDIFQEVFLRYIHKNPAFDNEDHRKAWLIRVTINCCKKLWTSAWFRRTTPLDDALSLQDVQENNLPHILDLDRALANLSPKYRTLIHLFYYEDLSVGEISDVLGIKPSTIRTQLTRARAMLKNILKGEV